MVTEGNQAWGGERAVESADVNYNVGYLKIYIILLTDVYINKFNF